VSLAVIAEDRRGIVMDSFKIDTVGARFRVDGVEGKTDKDGNPVKDVESGVQKFLVQVTVRYPDRMRTDKWMVTVVGQPKIAVDSYVSISNLVAYPWEHMGRHGIALRAESIAPESPAASGPRPVAASAPASS
jgi:hypothetical protein